MTKLIQLLGHDAAIAHDGHEAIVLATDCRPEQVLLDVGLPGMDGERSPPRPADCRGSSEKSRRIEELDVIFQGACSYCRTW
jgi:hypothetical protein